MRDLSEVMGDAFEARAQSLDGLSPDGGVSGLRARVRRRRAVRHTVQAVAVLPVVAALAVGAWYLGGDRPEPVATPEPSVSPSPSPTPTPTPEEPELVLGDPIDEPGLPTYYEMPDGLLDTVEVGWVLTVHRPQRYVGSDRYEVLANAVFLVAPDGTRFLATRLPLDVGVENLRWHAGETEVEALALQDGGSSSEREPVSLDLRSGALTSREGDAVWPTPDYLDLPTSPSGLEVGDRELGDFFTLWAVDGTGAQMAYGVPGKVCAPVGWLDDSGFLALCVDSAIQDAADDVYPGPNLLDFEPVLYRIGVDGNEPTVLRFLGADDPLPEAGEGVWVRDGVVAFPSVEGGPYGCWTGAGLWVEGELRSLQRPAGAQNVFTVEARGGIVFVEATPGCSGDTAPATLTGHDLAAGTSTVLAPAPEDWRPDEPGWVAYGLVAWAVAE